MLEVVNFYKFTPLSEDKYKALHRWAFTHATDLGLQGSILIGSEGVNGSLCGESEKLRNFIEAIRLELNVDTVEPKFAPTAKPAFVRLRVNFTSEIVTARLPFEFEKQDQSKYLSPSEWQEVLDRENPVVLDTRNWYETKIGKFATAIDPDITMFTEFDKYLEKFEVPKDEKILIYCTGGIRCEKATQIMTRHGFNNVYQLHGGILSYLKEFPNRSFDGECFVFDRRIAVDQNLNPSERYKLCACCGDPAERPYPCSVCGKTTHICELCDGKDWSFCSKTCRDRSRHLHKKQAVIA